MTIEFKNVARVTHEEGLRRDTQYWASRTMAERVIAGWDLADNNLFPQVPHESETRTVSTLRRITRSKR